MRANKLLIQCPVFFLLGSLASFSLEPYKVYPLIFCFTFAIFGICKASSFKEVLFLSLSFAFGWFCFGLYWVANAFLVKSGFYVFLMPVAVALLPLFLSLIWCMAFIAAKLLSSKIGEIHINTVIVLSIFEYLRGKLLNFPWLMPGHFFSSQEVLIQAFSFVGSFAMNIVILLIVILPILIFKYKKLSILPIFIFLLPTKFLFIKSYDRYLSKPIPRFSETHLIKVIQPNIKQEIKWKNNLKSDHHQKLINLSKLNQNNNNLLSILNIWPETAFLGLYPRDKNLLQDLSQSFLNPKKNEFLFTGLISRHQSDYFNSALLINSKAQINNIYNKNILVPFGEYIPFRKILPKFDFFKNKIDFSNGHKINAIAINNYYKFVPLICFEILFSDLIFKSLDKETSIIINITNDAWFGDSIGPIQHFQFAKIRAVEFGIPVIRVANTGYSGLVSPYGEVLKKLNFNKEGTLSFRLINKSNETIFRKFGDYIFLILISFIFIVNFLFKKFFLTREF
jgi:apolipoprotein N-acyltransferase